MPSSNNKPPILSLRSTVLVLCALLVGLTAGGLTYVTIKELAGNLETPSRPATPAGPNRATRRRYVKVADAAEYLDVTDRTIRQMIADGRLTAYRSGSRLVRLDLNGVDAAMKPFGGAA